MALSDDERIRKKAEGLRAKHGMTWPQAVEIAREVLGYSVDALIPPDPQWQRILDDIDRYAAASAALEPAPVS